MRRRLTMDEYRRSMDGIVSSLAANIGRKVLLITKDGRLRIPVIATLRLVGQRVYAEYAMYDARGRVESRRSVYVNPSLLYTGEQVVEYFEHGI